MSKICINKTNIVKVLQNTNSIEEASRILNVSPTTLSRRLKEYDIDKEKYLKNNRDRINLKLEDILEVQSKTNSAAEAARYLNVSVQTYKRRAEEFGVYYSNQGLKGGKKPKNPEIDLRKYSCNDNAFSVLTKESAYWLGFLAADGHIREDKNAICLVLKREDRGHLEKFQTFLNFTGPIIDRVRVLNELDYPISEMTVFSKEIVKDLVEKYKLSHLKTYYEIETVDFIPQMLKIYFYMGFFDADGGFSKLDGFCSIYSKKEYILQELKLFLFEKYDICSNLKYRELKKGFVWEINKNIDVYKFLKVYLKIGEEIELLDRKIYLAQKVFRYNGYN